MARQRALAASDKTIPTSKLMSTIAILCAMPQEVQPFQELLSLEEEPQRSAFPCFKGSYAEKTIVLALMGIGKAHAAAATQYVIDRYEPEAIFSCGSAGGLDNRCGIGDIVVASTTLQHDYGFELPEGFAHFGLRIFQKNRKRKFFKDFEADCHLLKKARTLIHDRNESFKVFSGPIVSGDRAVFSADAKTKLAEEFNALAVDMESAAIAQICKINMIPFLAIRAFSDHADESILLDRSRIDPQAFSDFCTRPGIKSLSRLSQTIRYLAQHPGQFILAHRARKNMELAAANSAKFTLCLTEIL